MKENTNIRRKRRQDLIEATIAVIAQHGYAGTTVSRVAKQAQVSAGLMNFHFDGKDRLFQAVFEYLDAEFDAVWREHLAAAPEEPKARLEAMVAAYFDRRILTAEKLPVWFTFWADAALRDRYRAAATRVELRYSKELAAEIKRLLAARPDTAPKSQLMRRTRDIAAPLIAMIDGYWLQAMLNPGRFSHRAAVQDCLNFLRSSLMQDPV
jgi:AcrR family transcriptional regulator